MSLEIIIGCMWSGKTSELIKRSKRLKSIGKKVLFVNHSIDDRYNENSKTTSHDGITIDDSEFSISTSVLIDVKNHISYTKADAISIDEAQFFNDLETVKTFVSEGKHVIVCGLNGDANRSPFGSILNLIPYADDVCFLTALCKVCADGTKGIFSKRIIPSTQEVISIGSDDKYICVCRKHYT